MSTENWVEKYRPATLDDIVGNVLIITRLKGLVSTNHLQNLIFVGPSGIAKTTSAICLANHFLKTRENIEEGLLEINASDDRSLIKLTQKLDKWCEKKFTLTQSPKIIILDEADNLPTSTQDMIATKMAFYRETTAWILIVNDLKNLIATFYNLCVIERFQPISHVDMEKRIFFILKNENLTIQKEGERKGIKLLLAYSKPQGDLRTLINHLETIYVTYKEMSDKIVEIYLPKPIELLCKEIFDSCLLQKNPVVSIKMYQNFIEPKHLMLSDILKHFEDLTATLNKVQKLKFEQIIMNMKEKFGKGCCTHLQIYSILTQFCLVK